MNLAGTGRSAGTVLHWSRDLALVDGDEPLRAVLQRLQHSNAAWLVLQRHGGALFYVLSLQELLRWPGLREALAAGRLSGDEALAQVLDLHETDSSTTLPPGEAVRTDEPAAPADAERPSIGRYVRVDDQRRPEAVGVWVANSAERPPPVGTPARGGGARRGTVARESAGGLRGATAAGGDSFLSGTSAPPALPGGRPPRPPSRRPVRGDALPTAGAEPPVAAVPEAGATDLSILVHEDLEDLGLMENYDISFDAPATGRPTLEDEGTAPLRHPSIEADRPLRPGQSAVLTVDLARAAVAHTQGGAVVLDGLPQDWQTLALTVLLQCPALDPPNHQAQVTVQRNADSLPARFEVQVSAQAAPGPTTVVATFLHGTRYCGTGLRLLPVVDSDAAVPPPSPNAAPQVTGSQGLVVVEPQAEAPDITVHIARLQAEKLGAAASTRAATGEQPVYLSWQVVTARFDGLPPQLQADIRLPRDPAAEAQALFKEFAVLERGQHTQRIEGFGGRLWQMAPPMFQAVYWAVWDRLKRPLSIQFISDEPHLPWELMRPVRADESEVHPPLALKHAVGRWIKRWDGYMRNQLPGGRLATIAPQYGAGRALKRAQAESALLETQFNARRTPGTHEAVLQLLEAPPAEPLGVLHFAGHGQFSTNAASHSVIKLEGGELAAAELERPEVRLGRACRTLVFFNACEVGATGAVFGEVGGWADAFLGRQFGGFVAPLWSVDDQDAGEVAQELLARILTQGQPIGAALRDVRAARGATSPTFYSYLYYGDVTARIKR